MDREELFSQKRAKSSLIGAIGQLPQQDSIFPSKSADIPILKRDYSKRILAGGLAGLCAETMIQPFDFVRTRHQISKKTNSGVLRTMINTYKTHGILIFYKGYSVGAVFSPIANSLYYAGYDFTKASLSGVLSAEKNPVLTHSISGFGAVLLAGTIMVPGDLVIQRAQATDDLRNSGLRVIKSVWRKEGIRGFYRNFGTSIGVWGPYCSIFFAVYEMMKSRLGMSASEESIGLKYIFCSGTAAAIGVLLTNPLDVIRVRSMVDGEGGLGGKAFRYKGVIHAFNDIIRKEGVRALGKGLKARILWYVANDAIGMTAYEKFKHWFGVSRGKFDGGNSGYC